MKVIGKTKDGFILEATEEDVAGIQGLYKYETKIDLGTEIDIAGLFNKYHSISIALNDVMKLEQTSKLLTDAVNWIKNFGG